MKYSYNHVHDDASLQDILEELAAGDSVRNLCEALGPERANAVGEQLTLLQQMMQRAHDYEEEAMAVHLDSDSLVSTKHQEKQQRCTQVT
jgi:hypothetical protein